MIKTVIMQPYLFPYLGYWQMIASANIFVLFDDVNFIKRGWINRNNILLNGAAHLFTLPLIEATQNKLINEISVTHNDKEKQKILKTIEAAYKKAMYFADVFPLITHILTYENHNLIQFLLHHFETIFAYLNIKTKLMCSSAIEKDNTLKSQDKIIDICHRLNTTHYVNAIGGQELYDKERFEQEHLTLAFIKMRNIRYPQFKNEFVPYLSIIDVLMFNSRETVKTMLMEYDLV